MASTKATKQMTRRPKPKMSRFFRVITTVDLTVKSLPDEEAARIVRGGQLSDLRDYRTDVGLFDAKRGDLEAAERARRRAVAAGVFKTAGAGIDGPHAVLCRVP